MVGASTTKIGVLERPIFWGFQDAYKPCRHMFILMFIFSTSLFNLIFYEGLISLLDFEQVSYDGLKKYSLAASGNIA